jgi:hypothetical protein
MRRVALGLAFALVTPACGPKPRPAPPPAELAVQGPADIAGDWVGDDEMAWSYALTIAPDGTLVGKVDRGKLPRCDREGRLTGGAARRFKLAMTKNTCEQATLNAGAADVEVASFTGDALTLTLVVVGEGDAERRTYRRRPR